MTKNLVTFYANWRNALGSSHNHAVFGATAKNGCLTMSVQHLNELHHYCVCVLCVKWRIDGYG